MPEKELKTKRYRVRKNIKLSKEQEFILQEREKCRKNPIYFLEKYCKVLTEASTPQPFKLYDFQKEKCIMPFLKHDACVIVKGRQTGVSTIVAGYALWKMFNEENFLTVILAIDRDTAINLIDKLKLMYDHIPSWLKPKMIRNNRQSFKFKNGSQIVSLAKGGQKGRSYSPKLLIFDEAGFIEGIEDVYVAAMPGLAKTRGQFIAISTPNGVGNWFHRAIAESPHNGFHSEWIYWHEMPDRDDEWKRKEIARLGYKKWSQEYNCDFLQSGNTVIEQNDIMWHEENNKIDPIEKINIIDPENQIHKLNKGKEVWIWEHPIPGRSYILSADVARGDGEDYSAFSIWKLPTEEDVERNIGPEQVVEFKAKVKTNDFGKMIDIMGTTYNKAIVIVENNSLGIATLNVLVENEYPNLYYTDKAAKQLSLNEGLDTQGITKVPGFTNSIKTRPLIADAVEAAWRSRQYIIRSIRQITEAKSWIWKNGRADHEEGCHDDLIMSSGFFFYLYQTSLRRQGVAQTRFIGALELISEKREKEIEDFSKRLFAIKRNEKDPYKVEYGDGEAWNTRELIGR